MRRYARACLIAYGAFAGAVFAIGLWQIFTPGPALIAQGLILAGGGPLAFLVFVRGLEAEQAGPPTLVVSIVCGLGCVLAAMAVYRYGDAHQWALMLATAALAGWLVCLRYFIRPGLE